MCKDRRRHSTTACGTVRTSLRNSWANFGWANTRSIPRRVSQHKSVNRQRPEPSSELSPGQSLVTVSSSTLSLPISLCACSDPHMTRYAAHMSPSSINTSHNGDRCTPNNALAHRALPNLHQWPCQASTLSSNHHLRIDLKTLANGLPLMAGIIITRGLIQTASGAQLVISSQI